MLFEESFGMSASLLRVIQCEGGPEKRIGYFTTLYRVRTSGKITNFQNYVGFKVLDMFLRILALTEISRWTLTKK